MFTGILLFKVVQIKIYQTASSAFPSLTDVSFGGMTSASVTPPRLLTSATASPTGWCHNHPVGVDIGHEQPDSPLVFTGLRTLKGVLTVVIVTRGGCDSLSQVKQGVEILN